MADMRDKEVADLLILVDATASMTSYLEALKQSLPQIISISALTNCFERIGILAYRDYAHNELLHWSGWMTCDHKSQQHNNVDLVEIAGNLHVARGDRDDHPEASKTGLAKAYEVMRNNAKTLVLLYADAPPHINKGSEGYHRNGRREQEALLDPQSYGGYGPLFADWVSAAKTLRDGEKMVQVIPILHFPYRAQESGYYDYLAAMTCGAAIHLHYSIPRTISEVTVEVLLAWMGVKKRGAGSIDLPAVLSWYKDTDLNEVNVETDLAAFFPSGNVVASQRLALTSILLEERLPKKGTPLQDFARTYKQDPTYRDTVTAHLRAIIERNVSAMSLNPVFGSLWRTFCNDRENANRQELLDLFGLKVNCISDKVERTKMKAWLEESYDYTAEVLEAIATVPEELQYPCVCLDPTLSYQTATKDEGEDEDNCPITSFKRDELLELGRSCDHRILQRLGRVLTRLTFVESADVAPSHITAAGPETVIKIPIALARKEYGRQFWRLLLHIVVPGTMLDSRAAALLGALALRMGVQPLRLAAETVMLSWRDKWNDVEVPETWNVSCLSLLLDADKGYQDRNNDGFTRPDAGLLYREDRQLFKSLVDYKMLELNLDTTLHARVAWTPQKTIMPIGPLVLCKICQYRRSVTVMGPNSVCGMCCFNRENPGCPDTEKADIHQYVAKSDTDLTNAYWYECNVQRCRAQYIVYDVGKLNVRPKCHYCRMGEIAPALECSKCLSKVIWPYEYRYGIDEAAFACVGCSQHRQTVTDIESTAKQLCAENGQDWLLTNLDNKLKEPFNGRSLFHTASNAVPLEDLCAKVQILPPQEPLHLTLSGKRVQNTAEVINSLRHWVYQRRTESGICSLCFSTSRKSTLRAACGRSGCLQQVCNSCLQGWYGLNAAGQILNTAALHCPFCRRAPASKTLAQHGMGVHAVANLCNAVKDRGEWIYAWCTDCGCARRYMERVCANGAPPHAERWQCEECRDLKAEGKVVKTRPCPGCGIETEKISGCDHIECEVPGCRVHWCFHCGEAKAEEEIYGHMNEAHGGYYGDLEEEDEHD
ncbi:hypothetical protein DOTSEDRAFT_71894 [Dothistroma septosporum NZE10]|uniref:RBR-type E3 ubiquitin transferase n=1 Tax=Dothistroma septosporum (strain NZE10 / CBS 128990) TaxID=675120 RepID=N1PL44_DOTSN|nr:hypothetical protein DOTSEDRAFT_71894 [Dothistroma septosporum NZE10]